MTRKDDITTLSDLELRSAFEDLCARSTREKISKDECKYLTDLAEVVRERGLGEALMPGYVVFHDVVAPS